MTKFSENQTEASVVAALAALASVNQIEIRRMDGGVPFALVPDNEGSAKAICLAPYDAPRKAGRAQFAEANDFIDYVKLYQDPSSRLFCSLQNRSFHAILDYHDPAAPSGRRGDLVASFALVFTPVMDAWQRVTRQAITQAVFVEFLEDRYEDIIEPAGADVLNLAKTLEVIESATFKSIQRNSDGLFNIAYEQNSGTKAGGNDQIEVPPRFLVKIQVFQGGPLVELPVRLRYKLTDGKVFFGLSFIGLDDLLQREVQLIRDKIAQETGKPVWAGSATVDDNDCPF